MRVVGVAAGDLLAEEALGGLVGRGDRRAVALALDGERVVAEPPEGELAGLPEQVDGLVDEGGVDSGHGRIVTSVRGSLTHGGRRVRSPRRRSAQPIIGAGCRGTAPEGGAMSEVSVETGAEVEPVLFNPFEPGFFDAPYAQYRRIREHEPVHHSPFDMWMLFAYEDCFRLLRDPGMSVDPRRRRRGRPGSRRTASTSSAQADPELPEPTPTGASSTSTRPTTPASASS